MDVSTLTLDIRLPQGRFPIVIGQHRVMWRGKLFSIAKVCR